MRADLDSLGMYKTGIELRNIARLHTYTLIQMSYVTTPSIYEENRQIQTVRYKG